MSKFISKPQLLRLWPGALPSPLQARLRHSCRLVLSNFAYASTGFNAHSWCVGWCTVLLGRIMELLNLGSHVAGWAPLEVAPCLSWRMGVTTYFLVVGLWRDIQKCFSHWLKWLLLLADFNLSNLCVCKICSFIRSLKLSVRKCYDFTFKWLSVFVKFSSGAYDTSVLKLETGETDPVLFAFNFHIFLL